jgi:hypothetical protein
MKREPLSLRLRFEIFKRDGFQCVYCGATPVQSPLHVDHVIPVAEGGDNKPSNLVTACRDCNLGKSAVPLERKRLAPAITTQADEDHAQQILAYLAIQRQVEAAKEEVVDVVAQRWEEVVGPLSAEMSNMLRHDVETWPYPKLDEAMRITARKTGSVGEPYVYWRSRDQAKYFHAILRNWREDLRWGADTCDVPGCIMPAWATKDSKGLCSRHAFGDAEETQSER